MFKTLITAAFAILAAVAFIGSDASNGSMVQAAPAKTSRA